MSDLVKRLRIKAGMIEMGERIAWGSDTDLMYEAADMIEQLMARDGQYTAEDMCSQASQGYRDGYAAALELVADTIAAPAVPDVAGLIPRPVIDWAETGAQDYRDSWSTRINGHIVGLHSDEERARNHAWALEAYLGMHNALSAHQKRETSHD